MEVAHGSTRLSSLMRQPMLAEMIIAADDSFPEINCVLVCIVISNIEKKWKNKIK